MAAGYLPYRANCGIDLDYFKQINDQHGHAVGDKTLQFFVTGLRAMSRVGDRFCRYGGEEFYVLLNCADLASIMAYDERLRQRLAQHAPKEPGFELSCSGAIAMRVHDIDTIANMLQRADVALYQAKSQGRGCTLISSVIRWCGPASPVAGCAGRRRRSARRGRRSGRRRFSGPCFQTG